MIMRTKGIKLIQRILNCNEPITNRELNIQAIFGNAILWTQRDPKQ